MKIRVPASSANLGPGFDCFGLAWQLYNEIEFELCDELVISGCPEQYLGADNLAYRAYAAAVEAAGRSPRGLRIHFAASDIPVSRGLGSSAALTVGGVLAADRLHSLGLSRQALLDIATAVEGHPDNVAPALFGGFTASSMAEGRAVTAHYALSGKLFFTVLIPDFELSTALARLVLPAQLKREDAVFNISRAALLLKALETGDGALLSLGLEDRVHQPYRQALIPGYDRAKELVLRCGGLGMCISGAGSTLLCISLDSAFSGKMASTMASEFPAWRVLPVLPDSKGATVL